MNAASVRLYFRTVQEAATRSHMLYVEGITHVLLLQKGSSEHLELKMKDRKTKEDWETVSDRQG